MTDDLQKEITPGAAVTLHGRTFRLTLPVRAVLVFKKETGIDLFNLGDKTEESESTENIVRLFHSMLVEHHPEVTFDEVTLLADLGNMPFLRTAVLECIASYLPAPRKDQREKLPNGETVQTG